jgi:hypothetical protein
MSESFKENSFYFDSQVIIRDTSSSTSSSGALVVKGGLSTKDTHITGHVAVNNVKITPNLSDIIHEQQAELLQAQYSWTDVTNFFFDNSTTTSFKAFVNVTVAAAESLYAIWEISGVYKPSGWSVSSSFTGDITGVNFRCFNKAGLGYIQYTNANGVGSTTTIRYRATTTAPIGTTPTNSVGLITNMTTGPFVANTLLYSNTISTVASTDLEYNSNVFKIGPTSKIVAQNGTSFTDFSSGGAITAMGDSSVAKNLIVGQKVGIANTSPVYSLDIVGDINFTGNFYQNNAPYSGSSVWQNSGNNLYYTGGNLGVNTTNPTSMLDVRGSVSATSYTGSTLQVSSATVSNVKLTNVSGSSATFTNGTFTNVTGGTLNVGNLTTGNINFTGTLYQNGVAYMSGQWTNTAGSAIVYTSGNVVVSNSLIATSNTNTIGSIITTGGNVGINVSNPSYKLHVSGDAYVSGNISSSNIKLTGDVNASGVNVTNVTSTNVVNTNLSSGSINTSSITTGTLHVSTSLSTGSIQSTNNTMTNVVSSSLSSGTAVISNSITTGTILASTSINTGTLNVTNVSSTNVVGTSLSAGTASFATGVTTGTILASTSVSTGALYSTNVTATNIVGTNVSASNIHAGYGSIGTVDSTLISASTITGGTLSLSGNLNVGGALTVVNITSTNLVETNVTTGFLLSGSIDTSILVVTNMTSANIVASALTAGTATFTSGITSGSVLVSTSVSAASLYSRSVTATNMVATNVSSGTASFTTGITTASILASTSVSSAALYSTNATSTNVVATALSAGTAAFTTGITTASILASTSVSSAALYSTNATSTNVVATALSAGNAMFTTSITAPSIQTTTVNATSVYSTNATSSNVVATTLSASNAIFTNVSTGTVNTTSLSSGTAVFTTGITTASILASTSVSAGALYGTNVTATNIVGTSVSAGTAVFTTGITTGTILASTSVSSASIQGTNSTITNAVHTALSSGTAAFTTGITTASILASTSVSSGALYSTNMTSSNGVITNLSTGTLNVGNLTTGSINFTGNLYQNGTAYISSQWTNTAGNAILYTSGNVIVNSGLTATSNTNTVGSLFTTGGNVGINTTSPGYKLHVVGDIYSSSAVYSTNITSTNIVGTAISSGTANLNTITAVNLSALTSVSSAALYSTNVTSTNIVATNSSITNVVLTNLTAKSVVVTSGGLIASFNSNTIGGLITTAGNVGIGTTSPNYKLDVNGDIGLPYANTIRVSGVTNTKLMEVVFANGTDQTRIYTPGNSSSTPKMVLQHNGNVGINTTSPNYTLDVSGGANILTSVTTGALYSTNVTSTNIVATNLSASNIYASYGSIGTVASTLISATTMTGGSISLSGNLSIGGTLTVVNITTTNLVDTNLSVGSIIASTSVSSGALYSTNATSTNIVATNLSAANIAFSSVNVSTGTISNLLSTNITTASILASTSISSGALYSTNVTSTNIVATNLSAANFTLSTVNVSTGTIGTLRSTTISSTNVLLTNMSASTSFTTNWTPAYNFFNTAPAANNAVIGAFGSTSASVSVPIMIGSALSTNNALQMNWNNATLGNTANSLTMSIYGGSGVPLTIRANGCVGINTATPNSMYALDVNGDMNVSSSLNAGFSVLANEHIITYMSSSSASFIGNWSDPTYWGIGRDSTLANTLRMGLCDVGGTWSGVANVYAGDITCATLTITSNAMNLTSGSINVSPINSNGNIRFALCNSRNTGGTLSTAFQVYANGMPGSSSQANFAINTNSGAYNLIAARSDANAAMYPICLGVSNNNGTNITRYLTMQTNGNVGIGTSTPAYALQVSTDSAAKPSTNTWTVSSDARLKTDIQLADLDVCYNNIKSIPLKRYTWRDDVYTEEQVPDRSKLGWIAQDVELVFPKAVEQRDMFGYSDCRSLNSDQLLASLYGAVQKMMNTIEEQDSTIQELKGQLSVLYGQQ